MPSFVARLVATCVLPAPLVPMTLILRPGGSVVMGTRLADGSQAALNPMRSGRARPDSVGAMKRTATRDGLISLRPPSACGRGDLGVARRLFVYCDAVHGTARSQLFQRKGRLHAWLELEGRAVEGTFVRTFGMNTPVALPRCRIHV